MPTYATTFSASPTYSSYTPPIDTVSKQLHLAKALYDLEIQQEVSNKACVVNNKKGEKELATQMENVFKHVYSKYHDAIKQAEKEDKISVAGKKMMERLDTHFGFLKADLPNMTTVQIAQMCGVDVSEVLEMNTLRIPLSEELVPGWESNQHLTTLTPFDYTPPEPPHLQAANESQKESHKKAAEEESHKGNHNEAAAHAQAAAHTTKNHADPHDEGDHAEHAKAAAHKAADAAVKGDHAKATKHAEEAAGHAKKAETKGKGGDKTKAEKIDPKKTLTALSKKKGPSAEKFIWNQLINEVSKVDGAALQQMQRLEWDAKGQQDSLDSQFKFQRENLEAQSRLGKSLPTPPPPQTRSYVSNGSWGTGTLPGSPLQMLSSFNNMFNSCQVLRPSQALNKQYM